MSTETRRIRVLLADDHSIVREGLQSMLERSEEFEVVGEARDGVEAVEAASKLSPDVIVMDVMMPRKGRRGGVPGDHGVSTRHKGDHADRLDGGGRCDRGAGRRCGRLSSEGGRNGPAPEYGAGRGCGRDAAADRGGEAGLRAGYGAAAKSKQVLDLTPREKEILVSFCRGMSYAAIAEARGVKMVTVRNAIYTIQVKLDVSSKQEIVIWAVRNGLLDD